MLDREIPTVGKAASAVDPVERSALSRRPIATAGDVIPVAPNLIATIVSFGFMMVVPWLVPWGDRWINPATPYSRTSVPGSSRRDGRRLVVALGAALLFLVIGMILQFWQHHRPFASWWPVVAGLPGCLGLALTRDAGPRDSVLVLDAGGVAIAVAFSRPLAGAGDGP